MKRKLVEQTEPKGTKKNGKIITAQAVGTVLILNLFQNKMIKARYCIDSETYQYETLNMETKVWEQRKFELAYEGRKYTGGYCCGYLTEKEVNFDSQEDRNQIKEILKEEYSYDVIQLIDSREREYGREKREQEEYSRKDRVNDIMHRILPVPKDVGSWIADTAAGDQAYFFFNTEKRRWKCTGCGADIEEKALKRADGGRPKHGDELICPDCERTCLTVRRTQRKKQSVNFTLIQPVDEKMGVVRLFDAEIIWNHQGRRVIWSEAVRLTLFKPASRRYVKRRLDIYYNQVAKTVELGYTQPDRNPCFDNRSNPANRRFCAGYLYDGGIHEALKETDYAHWIRVFTQMAETGVYADYNRLLASDSRDMPGLVEMLFKGRFFQLLREESAHIWYWNGTYTGNLNVRGSRIEEVFKISDRQKINRIRELDGGSLMVKWMRWSERKNTRIPDAVLKWICENGLGYGDMEWLLSRMSIVKAMNYIVRQQRESYQEKSVPEVISQYEDYIRMCQRLKKDTTDELVYRPRELKRRHDEAVMEIEMRQARISADAYSVRFPGVEEVMEEIREKYEYDSEQYIIRVPRRCVDIVLEGKLLHHCAGATDRYFDRIKQHEAYICFLRRAEEPDKPYYTIEVEPGGTIRQHRGYLDEEPEIEKIRPFLREWQQVVKRRMSEEDRHRARISAVKREENIEELKAKNNTRVLQGLMEDFMEAV